MASQAHLRILKQGVKGWNSWRSNYPDVQPDLAGVDLAGADLSGAHLDRADLTGADLSGTRLADASLRDADLTGAVLAKTELGAGKSTEWADLRGAILPARTDNVTFDRVVLDKAHLGVLESALALDIRRARWQRVHVGERADFDPRHDPRDASFWLIRQGEETLREALLRRGVDQAPDDVTVVFTQAVWRELYVVEMGLREALGEEGFALQKEDGRLALSFKSRGDLERGLAAIVVQLAALESVEPHRVKSMTVHSPDEEIVALHPADLKLDDVELRLERMGGMLDHRLLVEEELADARVEHRIGKLPGLKLFTPASARRYRHCREHFELLRRHRSRPALS